MKYHSEPKSRIIVDGTFYYCDSIERRTRGAVSETLTAEGRCLSRKAGSHPHEIIARGSFVPEDLGRITAMIRSFNTDHSIFVVDDEGIGGAVLLDGRASVSDGLGSFYLRFGVTDRGT